MNTNSTPSNSQSDSPVALSRESSEPLPEPVREEEAFALPEPDPDNITVLTNKLPDKPILPWNRYDSPWREGEEEVEGEENGNRDLEQPAETVVAVGEGEEIADEIEMEMEEEDPEIDEVE